MGCYAVPQIEKIIDGETWSRSSNTYSFSIWGMDNLDRKFLDFTLFNHWLGDQGTGYTELSREDVYDALEWFKPEERYRLLHGEGLALRILEDMETYGTYDYIQYNVG